MMTKTPQSSLQNVPAWNASPELRRAVSHLATRLIESLGDAACYLYCADKNRSFIPILSVGSAPNEQEVFLTTTLSPETDKLLHRMLARPMTLTFGQASNALRMADSILERLQAQFAVATPVLIEAELIGLLIVIRHAPRGNYSVDELRQIEWLAAAIAPVFQSTRQYYQTALQNLLKSVYDRKLFGSCFIERCLKPGLTCSPQA
jgi:GAF domain-containing protein